MMGQRCKYKVTLCLRSPFLFEGNVNTRTGVDSAMLRDDLGNPIIPDTQLRGVMRAALMSLAGVKDGTVIHEDTIKALFGTKSDNKNATDEQDIPNRALMIFSDCVAKVPKDYLQTTRIAIDEASGTVKTGAMQVMELALPFGETCIFEGTLVVRYTDGLNRQDIETALNKALRLIPAIGSNKSAGFGELVQKDCAITLLPDETFPLKPAGALPLADGSNIYHFDMTFDRALLVDTNRIDENVYESANIIPGAALKGAIANRLELAGVDVSGKSSSLSQAMETLRISHAFPLDASGNRLDLPIPRSLVYVEQNGKFILDDMIKQPPDTILLQPGKNGHVERVKFVASAKDKKGLRDYLGLAEFSPIRLSRTHVKIDDKRLTAEDGKLYSTIRISQRDDKTNQITWRFSLDFGKVAPGKDADMIRQVLGDPLDGIGRSAAIGNAVPAGGEPLETTGDGEMVDIMLVTPAMLYMPEEGAQTLSLFDSHAEYFNTMLPGVELVNLFAKRTMAGGYLATRRRLYGAKTYYPFILTSPGTVFRLKINNAAARARLQDALRYGLDPCEVDGHPIDWRRCAYVRENGYGEIILRKPEFDDDSGFIAVNAGDEHVC